jgi:hypothetical protein
MLHVHSQDLASDHSGEVKAASIGVFLVGYYRIIGLKNTIDNLSRFTFIKLSVKVYYYCIISYIMRFSKIGLEIVSNSFYIFYNLKPLGSQSKV